MLFPESDASLLRAWIIRRLANTSDADADVLADYVLALLRHDGDVESIRKMFEEEIPDFLREDAAAFTGDVFQAVKYRSYLPGAPPAPPSGRQALAPPPVAPLIPSYQPQVPYNTTSTAPAFPQNGSRKRAYNDRDDNDVDIILTSQGSYSGAQPYKQPRRGGGFSQRGGRFDESYKPRDQNGFSGPYPASSRSNGRFGLPPPPSFQPSTHDHGIPPINLDNLMENIQRMNQLDIPIPQLPDLPKPVYSGSIPPPRRRRQKCRDYETRGYCSRGSNCKFEHGSDSLMMPPLPPSANDEYDPNNAVFPMPLLANPHQPQAFQPLSLPPFSTATPTNRREHNKSRRTKGRPPNTTSGPIHDKTKTAIVVQNIPSGYFTEEKVREYFSQFGNIADISIQGPDRLAVVKFDTWDAAHAAWSSPKVIFDNRFVKVFWHKDDTESRPNSVNGKAGNGAKNGATNGNSLIEESAPTELFDMDEFIRKQEEAQKAHEEKTKKREELERQRQELEERQKELRARQLEEKRRLQAKLTGKSSSETTDDTTKKPTSQTEALKAQLAALEEEANVLGIDPDAIHEDSSWSTRGRGRGGRGYRGRGRYVARATRGGHSYQGRGGIEARHAAYAAYSLDNRPKIIALSGVDFTNLEKDEALRQYLFGIGEFKEIHTDPAATHITFKDRKTAEQFMMGVSANNAIPGLEDKVEITWATSAPQSETKTHADDNVPMANGIEDDQGARDKTSAEGSSSVTIGLEEGEVSNGHGRDQHDMDYEAGEDWDIS